ncbi:MAG: PAS domain-containing protein [Gemmatimonadales bacterium]
MSEDHAADEIKRLQGCITDLLGVLALPAIWAGRGPSEIAGALLDVLLGMLRLDFAYIRLSEAIDGSPIEWLQTGQHPGQVSQPGDMSRVLDRWLADPLSTPAVVSNPVGAGKVTIAAFRLGLQDEVGVLVAGSQRADFPTEIEKLLLQVASNQAAMGLQEARLLADQRGAAAELEQRVMDRTGQLAAMNEELRKEVGERKRAEEALRRSEAYLAEGQRLSQTGSWARNLQTGEVFWSREMYRMFGYEPGTPVTLEKIRQERVHPEDRTRLVQASDFAIHNKSILDHEYRISLPDGTVRFHKVVAHPVLDQSGEMVEIVGTTADVTEQHEASAALEQAFDEIKKSEDRLRLVIDTIPALVATLQPDGSANFYNRRWLEYLGLPLQEVLGWGWTRVTHPHDLEDFLLHWRAATASGEPFEREARLRRADGQYRWLLIRAVPLRGEQGKIADWYATSIDIEDRKRAEKAVRRSEAYLAEAQALSHTGSWAWSLSTDEMYWSEETFSILGLDPPTTRPSRHLFSQLWHPEDRDHAEQTIETAAREKRDYDMEVRLIRPDGSIRHAHVMGHPVLHQAGRVVEFMGVIMDVTERKRAERALRRARERILETRFAAALEERTRIARDIHDTLLQGFTGVALKLVAGVNQVTGPRETVAALHEVIGLAQQTLVDARRAVWDLRSPALASGDFPAAVRAAAEECVRGSGITLEYDVGGLPRPVAPAVEEVAVRVVQEALTNVVKHADARTVRVGLGFEPKGVRLTVIDDGHGFTVQLDNRAYGGHWGLLGMRERATQVRGKLSIRSMPGHGTEVVLLVPYAPGPRPPVIHTASSSAS